MQYFLLYIVYNLIGNLYCTHNIQTIPVLLLLLDDLQPEKIQKNTSRTLI